MCGNAGAPQFGQLIVLTALAFQLERRECVLAREVLYLGNAMIFLYFVRTALSLSGLKSSLSPVQAEAPISFVCVPVVL